MATIQPGLGQISSNYQVSGKKPVTLKNGEEDSSAGPSLDNLVSVNFAAGDSGPSQRIPPSGTPVPTQANAAAPVAEQQPPPPPGAPQGTAFGASGSLLMVADQPAAQESSSIDGFLARIANGARQGMESSGSVLQRAMVDAATFGNRVGKMLGCDEQAPGLRGAAGTTLSLTSAMLGGLVAVPLALVVGAADAVS
ncbi:MAG: hypothetical protein KF760_02280 [Candidatus Eremiobacteraeota bacterium]|nr:hypothetical protein [Candidatus Eremiobacteraeota bacterium]MCW5868865.1 hypothetical protein [Candidatus Eremiobacteraeota bacterium]